MCNTGMRPSEARNFQWRDIEYKTHKDGQKFVILKVRGYDLLVTLACLRVQVESGASIYCFRHTYATFRVDIYFLAKQMGTSVQMIAQHCGHVNPVKHAERILMGLPGWSPAATEGLTPANSGGVHADAAGQDPKEKCAPKKRARPSMAH